MMDSGDASKKNPLAGKDDPASGFLFAALVPIPGALIFSFFLGLQSLAIMVVLLVMATFYSLESFRLKEVPVLGFLLNGAMFGPLFTIGWINGGGRASESVLPMLFFSLPVLIMEVFHEMEDVDDDLKAGSNTLPTIIGLKGTWMIAVVLPAILMAFAFKLWSLAIFSSISFYATCIYVLISFGFLLALGKAAFQISHKVRLAMRVVTSVYGLAMVVSLL